MRDNTIPPPGSQHQEKRHDWAQAYANGADVRAAADRVLTKVNKVDPPPTGRELVFSALDLQRKQFKPIS